MRFAARLVAPLIALGLTAAASSAQERADTLLLELETGPVVIELLPEVAPDHVERIVTLAGQGFYDGMIFHRVIPGFMAQTGDPTGTGRGGSELPDLDAEFSDVPFERGTLGMARTRDPNSANSQFFIMFEPAPHLNGQYTVWGRVVDGMANVDAIEAGQPPSDPTEIVSMRVGADAADS
ncbi:MAG: peptidylprolyl isomerase [Alphaproteobacteria bacterium]|jgi:cyclophilin family peptidyl-prolyl cis-trans isomerase|nr:peptidylprolyl isomerase [Alphaproteobacteria bacterium]